MTQPRAVEKYYTVNQTAWLIELDRKTVIEKLPEFGAGVVDLAKSSPEDEPKSHDYRIPASGINLYLEKRRLFPTSEDLGVSARNEGELRRKSQSER